MTRDKLGADAGVAVSTIAKLESGRIAEPGLFTVWAICRALHYEFEDLFRYMEHDYADPDPDRPSGSFK